MKPNKGTIVGWGLALSLYSTLPCPAAPARAPAAAPAAASKAPPIEVQIPKSVFEDLPNGRDPFFPNSRRRQPKAPVVSTNQAPVVVERVSKSQYLTLSGISGSGAQRLALINNRPFKTGEIGEIRAPNGLIKVECVEIREKSVLIQIEGESERKELRLRESPQAGGIGTK